MVLQFGVARSAAGLTGYGGRLELVEHGRSGTSTGSRLGRDREALAASERRERDRGADEEADPEQQEAPSRVDAEVDEEHEREQASDRATAVHA